jgi:predicted ATPase
VVEDGLWTYEAQRLAAAVESLIGAADRGPTAGFSASSVIGREDLLTSLETTLVTERLVTLVGAGGCGKTTVATSLVERVAATARATFVDLTVVRDPTRVPRAIADAVGATDAEVDEELDAVARLMQARGDTLLAIDNCEHLLDACADAIARLLREVPELRVVTTSREPLAIEGERLLPVPPLGLPDEGADAESAATTDAVRLFLARARIAAPSFTLDDRTTAPVIDICRRLDGLPLAIELAASRVHVMDVAEIATRLTERLDVLGRTSRGGDPRHRTMVETLDWSYGLLQPPQAHLLDRLPVFQGGFTFDAVEAVCGDDGVDVLEALPSLVERSLVVAEPLKDGTRYRLLEPIRQYASDHLFGNTEAGRLAERHARYFAGFAERAEPLVRGPEQAMWKARVRRDVDNLRAAIAWSKDHDPEAMGQIVAGVWWCWPASNVELRSIALEGIDRLSSMSAATAEGVLACASQAALMYGENERCLELADRALAMGPNQPADDGARVNKGSALRELGRFDEAITCHLDGLRDPADAWFEARAVYSLGMVSLAAGDLEQAGTWLLRSRTAFATAGDDSGGLESLALLAFLALHSKDPGRALALCGEALSLEDDETFPADRVLVAVARGDALLSIGQSGEAVASLRESCRLLWEHGFFAMAPGVLARVAGLAQDRGRPDLALALLAASDRVSGGDGDLDADEGAAAHWFLAAGAIGRREVARAMLPRADAEAAWQRGLGTGVEALPTLVAEALDLLS